MMSLSALIFAAAIAAPSPAAIQAADLPRATIATNDLDLSTESGQTRLRARMAIAVRRMCTVDGRVDTEMSGLRAACVRTASKDADAAFTRAVASARRDTRLAAR